MTETLKIKFNLLKRTNFGFPSEWKYENIKISYRHGELKIYNNEELFLQTGKHWDEWDVNGYLSDEDLRVILKHHELLEDE